MWFTSDNAGPAHPNVIRAMSRAASSYSGSYGSDALTEGVTARIRELFEAPEASVYLVATGTAANALSLATLCPPWATIYCHRQSHVVDDECGAPEFYSNARLTLLEGDNGKLAPDTVAEALRRAAPQGVHNVQKGAVSITQVSERGTVYDLKTLRAIGAAAKAAGVPLHMDGARFANALQALDCTPAEMSWKAGVTALSLGGTKNGLMAAEAVVLFDPAYAWEFELRRKRGAQLLSKHRFLAAQMQAYLEDELWRSLAETANARAAQLAAGLLGVDGVTALHPVEANMLFLRLPRALHGTLQAGGAKYGEDSASMPSNPDSPTIDVRMVTNWATTRDAIEQLLSIAQS
ncbi:threonine aldolase family protein [Oceanibium sediminis]|uniref:threonine aldolase family protein n=1 Tax=Oceanibium sediminis TaxID=2026339 RepID=UPI000DD426AB|nr:beta-eliminating lyase-related protein [Oceanibium sediminis]